MVLIVVISDCVIKCDLTMKREVLLFVDIRHIFSIPTRFCSKMNVKLPSPL